MVSELCYRPQGSCPNVSSFLLLTGIRHASWIKGSPYLFLLCCCCFICQSCLTPWDPMNGSQAPLGFSQARVLKGLPFLLQGIFLTRDRTLVSCLAGRFFTTGAPGKPSLLSLSHIFHWYFLHLCSGFRWPELTHSFSYCLMLEATQSSNDTGFCV